VTLLDTVLTTLETLSERTIQPNELFFETVNKQFDHAKNTSTTTNMTTTSGPYFLQTHPKDKKSEFKIKHYAETVTYHAGPVKGSCSWGLKNNDKLPKELKATLMESNDRIVVEMMMMMSSTSVSGTSGTGGTPSSIHSEDSPQKRSSLTKSSNKKHSISGEFKHSITSLCTTLSQSNCAFIRCIKPNPLLKPLTYDELYTLQQIKSLGLVQVCSVMQIGLPTRITYAELKSLLQSLLNDLEPYFKNETEQVFIASLLYAFEIPSEIYQLGITRLFFKSGQLDVLENLLNIDYLTKKDEIISRVTNALNERKKCEELIQRLKREEKELLCDHLIRYNDLIKRTKDELVDIYQKNKELVQGQYSSMSLLDLNMTGERMSSCQFAVDDVEKYGSNLTAYDVYHTTLIPNILSGNREQLSLLEKLWSEMNGSIVKIELYLKENYVQSAVEDCYHERGNELIKYFQEMNHITHSINGIVLDSNRCLISKAMRRGEELQQQIQTFQNNLALQFQNSEKEYSNLKKDETNRQKVLGKLFEQLGTHQLESTRICDEIQSSCATVRAEMDHLRKKIIDDEERLKEEIQRAEEQERLDRERREIEAAIEYELKVSPPSSLPSFLLDV
jgi:myosin heavy subunit